MKITDEQMMKALTEGGITRNGLCGFVIKTDVNSFGRFHQYKPNGEYYGSYELTLADLQSDKWESVHWKALLD